MRNFLVKQLLTLGGEVELPARKRLPLVVHKRGMVGSGKTREWLQQKAAEDDRKTVMTGLTNRLAAQNKADFEKTYMAQQTAQHYVGNDYISEDEQHFGCHEDFRDYRAMLGKAGGDMTMACGTYRDKEGQLQFRCLHGQRRTCMISRQIAEGADVVFTSTATLKKPMRGSKKPTTRSPVEELCIDETLQPLRKVHHFPPDVMSKPFGIQQYGNGTELSASEDDAVGVIARRRADLILPKETQRLNDLEAAAVQSRLDDACSAAPEGVLPDVAHDNIVETVKAEFQEQRRKLPEVLFSRMLPGAYFDVIAIRQITSTLQRLNNEPLGGTIERWDLPSLASVSRLVDLFSHTMIERPTTSSDWSNPSRKKKKRIADLVTQNAPFRRAAEFGSALMELMSLPPLHSRIPGIRVMPENDSAAQDRRVALGQIIPINGSYNTDKVTWLDATGSSALAQLTHFEEVVQDPVETPLWAFGDQNRIVKLMHRQDGPRSRWTADRLFDDDGKITWLGWMTFITIAHLKTTFLSQKGVDSPSPSELLFVTTKAVKEKMPPILPGTDIENFKAVNGSNKWKDAHAEAILLTPASTPRNYWELAEASDGQPRPDPGAWWTMKEHQILVKNTDEILTTYINSHDDPLLAEYYREYVTADFWQAFRLRSQWRSDPTLYIVANNEPLPPGIHPNEVIFVEDRGGWYHHLAAFFGIVPELRSFMNRKGFSQHVPEVAAELLFDRFEDAEGIRDFMRNRRHLQHHTPEGLDGTHGFTSTYPIQIRLPGKRNTMWLMNAPDRTVAKKYCSRLATKLPPGSVVKVRSQKR